MSPTPESASRHRSSERVYATDVFGTGGPLADETDDDPSAADPSASATGIVVQSVHAPDRAWIGEPVGVVVTVENVDETTASLSDELLVDARRARSHLGDRREAGRGGGAERINRESFTTDAVAPGESTDVVLAASFGDAGVYILSLRESGHATVVRVGVD